MPNLVVANRELREEKERLEREVEQLRTGKVIDERYAHLSDEEDGRGEMVEILYRNPSVVDPAAGASKFVKEILPLQQGFDKLVNFYSSYSKLTDRNVPKDYWDGRKPVPCNTAVCYVRKTFVDRVSGDLIENLMKEVPLWLAVDDRVQKGQSVELISKKEYNEFYKNHVKKELRADRAFQESKNKKALEELINEEL